MIFNNSATRDDLCTIADDYANTTVLTYPIERKARAANKISRLIWSWIYKAYGGWQYDDSNNTNLPIALATLTLGQSDYDIPAGAKNIRGIDILPPTGTVYQPLTLITEEQIRDMGQAEGSFQQTTTGVPQFYRPIGTSIKLYPASNYTVTNGIRVTIDRGIVAFSPTGNDTQTPGFDSTYHEAVGVGMALEFAKQNHLSNTGDLQLDMDRYEKTIEADYSSRLAQKYPPRLTSRDETASYI